MKCSATSSDGLNVEPEPSEFAGYTQSTSSAPSRGSFTSNVTLEPQLLTELSVFECERATNASPAIPTPPTLAAPTLVANDTEAVDARSVSPSASDSSDSGSTPCGKSSESPGSKRKYFFSRWCIAVFRSSCSHVRGNRKLPSFIWFFTLGSASRMFSSTSSSGPGL